MGSENKICFLFHSTHPRRVWLIAFTMMTAPMSFNPHTHEGCDLNNLSSSAAQFSFNPHTHEGCDIALVLVAFMMIGFNPHTHEGCDYWEQKTNQRLKFQSTHPRRVWPFFPFLLHLMLRFQSTHPRRVWRLWRRHSVSARSFNPHTHEGCDYSGCTF